MTEETECVFDFETNGTDKGFRLPHQLAVIDLNNLDNLSVINNRLPTYDLPSPGALKATSTPWKKLMEGPSLYESIPKILESLDYDILWAYNSQYDSNVLTEALYTSGFFPYPHKMGDKVICDALPFISLAGKIYPETIKTPKVIDGKRNQSLSNVFMNNFAKDESIIWHQADGDVKATAKLLKKIKFEQPNYWTTRTKMFSKFSRYKIFSDKAKFATYYFPKQKITEFIPVVDIDNDNYYSINLEEFFENGCLTEKNITTLEKGKKPKWLKETYLKTPGIIFCPEWYDLEEKYQLPSKDQIEIISNLIKDYLPLKKEWPKNESDHLETQIFGFPANEDKTAWEEFHNANSWDKKIQIKFSDIRSKRIAQRIIFDNSPETIDEEPYKILLEFIKSRWLSNNFKSPWITIPNALREIEKFEEREEQEIFEGYKDYLMEMRENL